MALVNRDKDASEQREVQTVNVGAVATGVTRFLHVITYPCILEQVRVAAAGVSNAMQLQFEKITGATTGAIQMGISNMILQNRSTSGIIGYSGLAAPGSTLLALSVGDVLQVTSSVASGNATDLSIVWVLKKTQDILSYNGVVVS